MVRKRVVSVEAQTRTNEAKITDDGWYWYLPSLRNTHLLGILLLMLLFIIYLKKKSIKRKCRVDVIDATKAIAKC